MHIEKYKSQAIGNMINHYRRSFIGTLKRDNIFPERTKDNYEIGNKTPSDMGDAIRVLVAMVERQNGRKLRKDANLMADLVLTLPPNVPECDERRFFEESAKFIYMKLGANGMSGESAFKVYVHKDEATPHAHIAFTPLYEDKNGRLAFNYKKVVPLRFYKTLHKELQEYLTVVFGYEPQLLREGDDKLKALSKLDQEEYKRVKDEVKAQIGELNEQKTQAQAELEELLDEKKALERRLKACEEPLPVLKMSVLDKLKDEKKQVELQKELKNLKSKLKSYEVKCQKVRDSTELFFKMDLEDCESELNNLETELNVL